MRSFDIRFFSKIVGTEFLKEILKNLFFRIKKLAPTILFTKGIQNTFCDFLKVNGQSLRVKIHISISTRDM